MALIEPLSVLSKFGISIYTANFIQTKCMNEVEISIFPEVTVEYATFWQRFASAFLDGMVLLIPNMLISNFLIPNLSISKSVGADSFYHGLIDSHFLTAAFTQQMLQIALSLFYFAIMESSRAQATIGKQALGLKVTSTTGEPIAFTKALGRNAGKLVSKIIFFIGYFMMLWDDRNQTLHDRMAGSLVVKK